jgi:hypothetical protein
VTLDGEGDEDTRGEDGTGAAAAPVRACSSLPARAGAPVACTITGGDPDVTILRRTAHNSTSAEEGVSLAEQRTGTFTFVVPARTVGVQFTVELVDWPVPVPLGAVGPRDPATLPCPCRRARARPGRDRDAACRAA